MPLLFRVVSARPRLFLSTAVGLAAFIVTAFVTDWRFATRLLTGWDIAVALYLALAIHVCATPTSGASAAMPPGRTTGSWTILTCTVAAALASLAAIFAELGMSATGAARPRSHLFLAASTILLSWAFIHTMFALHYAHEFYDETRRARHELSGRRPASGLPGLRLLLVRDRHDLAGVRRGDHQQARSVAPPPPTASCRFCSTRRCSR